MAKKISQLLQSSSPAVSDLLEVVVSGNSRKVTVDDLASAIIKNSTAFLQSGTPAIARDLQDKGRDFVSVFDCLTTAQKANVRAGTAQDLTATLQAVVDEYQYLVWPGGVYHVGNLIFRKDYQQHLFLNDDESGVPALLKARSSSAQDKG